MEIPIIASAFVQRYIDLVKADPVIDALKKNKRTWLELMTSMPVDKIEYAYAPGKWTVKEMLQHVIDSERVFSFRAVWFARTPGSSLPGFEEKAWANEAVVAPRNWNHMIEEFTNLRQATENLFESFTEKDLAAHGMASDSPINVYAIGYQIAGHLQHHVNILEERYL